MVIYMLGLCLLLLLQTACVSTLSLPVRHGNYAFA